MTMLRTKKVLPSSGVRILEAKDYECLFFRNFVTNLLDQKKGVVTWNLKKYLHRKYKKIE